MQEQPEGNYYDKYNTSNPIAQRLMSGFFRDLDNLLSQLTFGSLYEAGCGEGYVIEHVRSNYANAILHASDISSRTISEAKTRSPGIEYAVSSIYSLPVADESFDVAMALEVFEHLEDPTAGLLELLRISKRYIIISVPNEPIWRISNMARGKYWSQLGNTPGHIQHWSPAGFRDFASQHCNILLTKQPFPWTMLLCEK